MAVTDQQKLDFLLKKIGYTKTKTGSVVGTGAISGTPKQPFAEAIPSPLIIANGALWNEADSIPTTPPGADTTQVKVYLAATSGLRMTADATSSGQRAYIAYSTYGNTSSTRLTNWIDTQFGASYIIKVYKGDPNSGGVALSAAGSGANDGWFFDYSAGVLNFNDTNVPSGVTDTNIYIVGYRYIGQTGAPTSGISTFSFKDLTVERNLDVGVQGGISTFRNNIDLNADLDVDGHTNLDNVNIAGVTTVASRLLIGTTIEGHPNADDLTIATSGDTGITIRSGTSNNGRIYFSDATSGTGEVVGSLDYDHNDNKFSIHTNGGERLRIDSSGRLLLGTDTEGHANADDLTIATSGDTGITIRSGTTHNGRIYFSDATSGAGEVVGSLDYDHNNDSFSIFTGGGLRLRINGDGNVGISNDLTVDGNLDVDGHTNLDNVSIAGFTTITQDLDVDGHTNLDNISVAGVSTFTGDATFSGNVSIGGTLTYEDVTNVDSVGLLTARSGIRVTGGVIEAQAGENKIPSLYANMAALPSPSTYHGMFAHVHSTGRGYFAHGGAWYELVNADLTGRVGTGTESYFIDRLVSTSTTATSLNVVGVATFGGNVDVNGNVFDADGHVELDNVNIAGVTTFAGNIDANADLDVDGHTNLDNVSIVGVTTTTGNLNVTDGRILIAQSTAPQVRINSSTADGSTTRFTFGLATSSNNFINGALSNDACIAAPSNILFGISSTRKFRIKTNDVLTDVDFIPSANVAISLGRSNARWSDLFTVDANISGDIDVDGHTELDNLRVSGISTFLNNIVVNANADINGNLFVQNKIETNGDLKVSGVSTFSDNVTVSGNSTFTGNIDLNADLDVDGHTNLDNVSIAGVTTTSGLLDINAGGQANTFKVEDLTSGRVVLAGTGGELEDSNNLRFDGTDLFVSGIRVGAGGGGIIGLDITTRNLKATGLSTFVGQSEFDGNVKFDSTITAGGSVGTNNQYLKSTGSGVAWASFPTARTSQLFTASAGQTTFSFSYTVGLVDVFVNGIKLSTSEFTATNGSSVVLAVGCFVGDIVEILSYNVATGGGGGGTLSNIVEDTTPQLGGNLDLFNKTINGTGNINITGVVTATQFKGDGSGLTGIVASGSGVVVKDGGSTVGTAGTINFGDNLSVSAISAGIVTITGFSGITTTSGVVSIANDLDVDGHTNLDNVSIAGVSTFGDDINISGRVTCSAITINDSQPGLVFEDTNANPDFILQNRNGSFAIRDITSTPGVNRFFVNAANGNVTVTGDIDVSGDLDVDGHTNLDNVSIDGVTIFAGNIGGTATFNNIDVDGHTELDNVNIAGVVTATTFKGALQGTSGTFSSGVDITGDLDVDGHTNLDNVSVAGVSTFAGAIDLNADLDVDGHTNLDNLSVSGVSTFADDITVQKNMHFGDSPNGTENLLSFGAGNDLSIFHSGNGSFIRDSGTGSLTVLTNFFLVRNAANNEELIEAGQNSSVNLFFNGVKKLETTAQGIEVTGHSELDNVNIAGVTTFASNVSVGSSIAVGTGVTIETNGQATYTGIVTALKFVGDGSGLTNLPGGGSYGNNDVDNHLNVSGASSGQILSWNGSDYAWVADQTGGGGSGISTISGVVNIANDLDVDGHTNLDNVSVAGIVTTAGGLNVSGGTLDVATQIRKSSGTLDYLAATHTFSNAAGSTEYFRFASSGQLGIGGANYGTSGQVLTSGGSGSAASWTTLSIPDQVGITTSLSGSFTASAGSPSTINTFGYGSGDLVVEYTIYIKNGSDFQTQKLLAMRDGTTIHSTQFAVMFSSSLLVQCDATISSGNILLRATPETGVSGSTTYKIKREVM